MKKLLVLLLLPVNLWSAQIGSINDLTSLGGGVYQRRYSSAPSQRGFVTSDNLILSQTWYGKARYKFSSTWKWGSTAYGGGDHAFSNDKIVRFWNPGSTKENCYVELTGYEGSNGTAKFVIEDVNGNQVFQKYFFDGFKNVFKPGTEHTIEYFFKDSDSGVANGTFRMVVNGTEVCNIQGFKSRTNGGLKRFYILGLEEEWGSNSNNTLTLSGIEMKEGVVSAPSPTPTVTPTPTITPCPSPTPCPSCPVYPAEFKSWWNSRPSLLDSDLP